MHRDCPCSHSKFTVVAEGVEGGGGGGGGVGEGGGVVGEGGVLGESGGVLGGEGDPAVIGGGH